MCWAVTVVTYEASSLRAKAPYAEASDGLRKAG